MIEIVPYFTAGAALVAAIVAIVGAVNAAHARKAAERAEGGLVEIDGKLYRLDERVDGRLTELLRANSAKAATEATLARAEGHAEGEQAQRDRAADAKP